MTCPPKLNQDTNKKKSHQSIFRLASPSQNFKIVSQNLLRDPEITPRSFRVLLYLLSHKDTFELHPNEVYKNINMGLKTVYKSFKELKELGYMSEDASVVKGENGKILNRIVNYYITDTKGFFNTENRDGNLCHDRMDKDTKHHYNKEEEKQVLKENKEECSVLSRRREDEKKEDLVFREEVACDEIVKENSVEEDKKDSRYNCEKLTMTGKVIAISLQDIFKKSVNNKDEFTTKEIEKAWDVLYDYKGYVSDGYKFIQGVIKNMRKQKPKSPKKEKCRVAPLKKKKQLDYRDLEVIDGTKFIDVSKI